MQPFSRSALSPLSALGFDQKPARPTGWEADIAAALPTVGVEDWLTGLFDDPDDNPCVAQARMRDAIIDTIGLGRDEAVLDLGSSKPWRALHLAQACGCRVYRVVPIFAGGGEEAALAPFGLHDLVELGPEPLPVPVFDAAVAAAPPFGNETLNQLRTAALRLRRGGCLFIEATLGTGPRPGPAPLLSLPQFERYAWRLGLRDVPDGRFNRSDDHWQMLSDFLARAERGGLPEPVLSHALARLVHLRDSIQAGRTQRLAFVLAR